MTPKSQKRANGRAPSSRKPRTKARKPTRVKTVLDKAAIDYARLLVDPCGAGVVPPIYPGSDAGFLFRAENFFSFGIGATETAGVIHWAPGYVNATSSQLVGIAAANPSTAGTAAVRGNTDSPGATFLASNARGARCIAACLKVTYPGGESARSGRIHYGHTNAGLIDAGNSLTVDSVAQALQFYTRTPADTIELIWKPNIADTEFNDPSEAASSVIRDRKSALTVAFAGLPAGVGLTFHFTAVYEWTPTSGIGIGHNSMGKATSRNSLDDVIDSLKETGFKFTRGVGAYMGAGFAAGVANTVSSYFGNMPARVRMRNLAFH